MEITEIIGKKNIFSPPFVCDDSPSIKDSNGILVLTVEYKGLEWRGLDCSVRHDIRIKLAKHICELLNERWNKSSTD